MKKLLTLSFAFAITLGVASQVSSEEKEKTKYISLMAALADGYEVKATSTGSVVVDNKSIPHIYVTLQKGKSIAVCSFAIENYDNLADASVNAIRCSVR